MRTQFAMFQKAEDDATGTAEALFCWAVPKEVRLAAGTGIIPVGAGGYGRASIRKSWFDYTWDRFPAHVTVEQFSPILSGQLQRDKLSSSGVPLACGESHKKRNHRERVCFLGPTCLAGPAARARNFSRCIE